MSHKDISYTDKTHYVAEEKEGDEIYIYKCIDCGEEFRQDYMG